MQLVAVGSEMQKFKVRSSLVSLIFACSSFDFRLTDWVGKLWVFSLWVVVATD